MRMHECNAKAELDIRSKLLHCRDKPEQLVAKTQTMPDNIFHVGVLRKIPHVITGLDMDMEWWIGLWTGVWNKHTYINTFSVAIPAP